VIVFIVWFPSRPDHMSAGTTRAPMTITCPWADASAGAVTVGSQKPAKKSVARRRCHPVRVRADHCSFSDMLDIEIQ
jgi:hypothetical protein